MTALAGTTGQADMTLRIDVFAESGNRRVFAAEVRPVVDEHVIAGL